MTADRMTAQEDRMEQVARVEALIDRRSFVRRTYVRTPVVTSGGLTVWHVREFVRALDQAGIPDSAQINSRKANDTYHLIELSAYLEETHE